MKHLNFSYHLLPLIPPSLQLLCNIFLMLAKEKLLPWKVLGLMAIWDIFRTQPFMWRVQQVGKVPVGTMAVKCLQCKWWRRSTEIPFFPTDDLTQQAGWGHSPSLLVPAPISEASIWATLDRMNSQVSPTFGPSSSMAQLKWAKTTVLPHN